MKEKLTAIVNEMRETTDNFLDEKMCTLTCDGAENLCSLECPDTCGDCGVDTKNRYVEILEFTQFVEFFTFNKIADNHKEKELVKKITVVVALDLGSGNTKNFEYESE